MKLIKDLGMKESSEIRKDTGKPRKHRIGIYECPVCLTHFEANTSSVNRKRSTKCMSCARRIQNTKHGMTAFGKEADIYVVYKAMMNRCYTLVSGAIVCDEWKHNPTSFCSWALDNGYIKGLHLDKDILCERDNISPKVYSPETCMFITGSENSKESAIRNNPSRKGRKYERKKA